MEFLIHFSMDLDFAVAECTQSFDGAMETLENPAILRENGPVIAGADWLHGHQAVWFW